MSETFESSASQKVKSKKRGKLLTYWLVSMLLGNIVIALYYLLWNSAAITVSPNTPSWIFYIYGIIGLANATFTIFLLRWKKWAFFAYCGSATVVAVLNLLVATGTPVATSSLAGPAILYLILRSRWSLLE